MIRIYTAPSCASCRKVKSWLNENKIPYVEKNIFSTLLKESELRELLERSENGTDDIISKRSKIIKENQIDVDDMTTNELIEFIQNINNVMVRINVLSGTLPQNRQDALIEHENIIAFLKKGQREFAKVALSEHLKHVEERMLSESKKER